MDGIQIMALYKVSDQALKTTSLTSSVGNS